MNREKLEQKARDLCYELNIGGGYWDLDFSCYTDFGLKMEIKKMEKIIRQREKEELYINIKDYQGGNFAVGCIGNLKEWREKAIYWCDNDNYESLVKMLENYKIKNNELIDFIQDFWSIEIVKFDKNVDYEEEYNLELYYM